jgi:hypothetical protein
MKFIFTLVLALAFQVAGHAASPSFDSFNTNQFVVSASKIISDRLWTNNAGTIQASSTVADGASAVGFKMNSSNTLANTGANIVEAQNNGTNVLTVNAWGGGFNGRYAESVWGGPSGNYYAYVRADSEGGIDYQWIGVDDANFLIQNFIVLRLNSTEAQFSVSDKAVLFPTKGATSTPYLFDTTLTHTSGNLLEVANNGTNKFVVPFDGSVQIPGDATANSLTITNDLNVHGSIKVNTLTVTNNVQFYNNTYVSNIYVTNILTAAGSSVFNTFTAESGTVSNNLTVLGNYVGTIDPAQTGTTLKQIKSLKLQFPRLVDGAGCTYANTNDYTALTFMLPQFSGTGATNANYCDFAFRVPTDLDTSVDLTASLTVRLTAADTSGHTYDVGMVSIANSGAAAGTPANFVALTVTGDGSGASGDIESVSAVTLTSWKSNLTAGQWCLLRLNRDGANDASTVASNLMELEIFYTSTQ